MEDVYVKVDEDETLAIPKSVTLTVTTIVVESANFDGDSVRTTSKKLGLRTEASSRFEKGIDPNLCKDAGNVLYTLFAKSWDIFKRALCVIFLISVIFWALSFSSTGRAENRLT